MPNVLPWHLKRALRKAAQRTRTDAAINTESSDAAQEARRIAVRALLDGVPEHELQEARADRKSVV